MKVGPDLVSKAIKVSIIPKKPKRSHTVGHREIYRSGSPAFGSTAVLRQADGSVNWKAFVD